MYTYQASVVRVVDADTVDMDVDLGFFMTARIRFRLARINAWETRGEEREKGLSAKSFVESILWPGRIVPIQTGKTGKYGRWIAEITIGDLNLSDKLVELGHARYQEY